MNKPMLSHERKKEYQQNELEALAAAKQSQDTIKTKQIQDTRSMEESTGNCSSKPLIVEDQVPSSSPTPVAVSPLARNPRTFPEHLVPWTSPVDIDTLANGMATLIRSHCVMTDHEADTAVLWVVSSYLINAFEIFPKLSLISPEKRCGKSTAMRAVSSMCKDGLLTSNTSSAAIYRLTENYALTLFIDEADTLLKSGNPELVGLINSSHNKSSSDILRCSGEDHTPKAYSTWMPMVLASIGELPSTIMDRSIVINLRRMKASENVVRIPGNFNDACQIIRRQLLSWCESHFRAIESSPVEPPRIGNDRATDNWLPLFTVAGQIGKSWPTKCEAAYATLTTVSELEESTQLLADLSRILSEYPDQRIYSEELIHKLCEDDTGPWLTCNYGKRITASHMAKLLRPYSIKPKCFRVGSNTRRGYEKFQFGDVFERYLDPTSP